jgi:hypothetical protein
LATNFLYKLKSIPSRAQLLSAPPPRLLNIFTFASLVCLAEARTNEQLELMDGRATSSDEAGWLLVELGETRWP